MSDDPILLNPRRPTKLAAFASCALAAALPGNSYAQADALEAGGLRVETNVPCAGLCPTVAAADAQGRMIVEQDNWSAREQAVRSLLGARAVPEVTELLEWLRPTGARRVDLICPLVPPGDAATTWRLDKRFRFFSICTYDRAASGAAPPDVRRPQ